LIFGYLKLIEQTAIANYLDKKTAHVDKLGLPISKKLIELPERGADGRYINHASTTKGINTKVKFQTPAALTGSEISAGAVGSGRS